MTQDRSEAYLYIVVSKFSRKIKILDVFVVGFFHPKIPMRQNLSSCPGDAWLLSHTYDTSHRSDDANKPTEFTRQSPPSFYRLNDPFTTLYRLQEVLYITTIVLMIW
jgi:hypothetical protein